MQRRTSARQEGMVADVATRTEAAARLEGEIARADRGDADGVGKKKKPDFGTRGRKQVEPTDRKATVVQRLTKMGTGWWAASGLQTKKPPHAKGVKRARP